MNTSNLAVPSDISIVDHRINELKDCSNEFSQLVAELSHRLAPVLQPEQIAMAEIASGGAAKAVEFSPIANQLSGLTGCLRNDASFLRSLINRLEV